MRLVLAVLLLAACSPKPAAPAWPKMAEREADGGESLEPRAKASAIAAVAKDDEPVVEKTDKPAAKPDAKPDAETPKPASTSTQAPEEIIITTEEIVIEIDD